MPSWSGNRGSVFDPATTPASKDLGVIAEHFRRRPGAVRSGHCFAFAAEGPRARIIVGDPICFPPHDRTSPVGRVRDAAGQILLLGVGHTASTTIHLAELVAGARYRRLKHCRVMENGTVKRIAYSENDHCCERFALVDGWLGERGLQQEGMVGSAFCRLVRSRDLVDTVAGCLDRDPLAFLHPDGSGCAQCEEARWSLAFR